MLALGILVAVALPTFLGARTRAQDKAAQSDLRNAMAAALTFYTDGDTFSGFSPATAVRIEPSIAWAGDAKATRPGTVYIDRADKRIVIMTSRSASGAVFCIADDLSTGSFGGSVSYGTRDAFGTTRATGCGAPTPWP